MTIGRIALLFCAAIWCACAAFALAALVGRARRAMRRYGVSARVVFLLAAAACVMLAGGKSGSVSVLDAYIQDAGSYLTNDVAHVALSKKTPSLPDSTEILVYARELSSTNAADWFRLSPHLTYADHPYDYALPNATNYSVLVSSSFVPEPTVHTNGVWALRGFEIPGHPGKYAFGNSRVRTIVTASDYVQDGLIAMWDGIENAGWGTHISSGKWVDLIGGLQSYTTAEFTENANIAHPGTAGTFEFSNDEKFSRIVNNFTVEVVLVDGGWSNFTYAHSLQYLIRDTDNGLRTLFQATVPSAASIVDARYFLNKPGIVNLGSLTPVPGGGYARALTQTFDGTSCKAFLCGVFEDQYDGALTWSPIIGTLQYRLRVYNTGSIFKYHALRVYSRALSADEIRHNYEIDKERFNLP